MDFAENDAIILRLFHGMQRLDSRNVRVKKADVIGVYDKNHEFQPDDVEKRLNDKKGSNYLYKMLDEISKSSKNDFIISYRLFSQMATPFNKTDINSKIYRNYAFDDSYKKTLNKHVLNNLVENTKLTVYNTYIKIKTNKNAFCRGIS